LGKALEIRLLGELEVFFTGMLIAGTVASSAAMSSVRSRPSASTRATSCARFAVCWAIGTGLPFTSCAPGSKGGSLLWSTVLAHVPSAALWQSP